MESKLLTSLGKIAGIEGISVGVLFLLFSKVLRDKYLPQSGLSGSQAFHVIIAVLIFTFGIAAIGIITWGVSRNSQGLVSKTTVAILAVLVIAVLFTSSKVGTTDNDASNTSASQGASPTATTTTPVPTPPRKYFFGKASSS